LIPELNDPRCPHPSDLWQQHQLHCACGIEIDADRRYLSDLADADGWREKSGVAHVARDPADQKQRSERQQPDGLRPMERRQAASPR